MSTLEQGGTEPEGDGAGTSTDGAGPGAPAADGTAESAPHGASESATDVADPAPDTDGPADPPAVLAPDVVADDPAVAEPAAETPADPPPSWAGSAERVSEPTDLDLAAIADRSRVRRAPRFGRFAGFGVALGVLIAFTLSRFGTPTEYLDRNGMFIVLMAMLAPFGALVACLIAVLLDRTSERHLDADRNLRANQR